MSAADEDRVVERLRALADHARTEPERALGDTRVVRPYRAAASPARARALRVGVLVGVAAACAALVLAVRRPATDEAGDTAVSSTAGTVTTAPPPVPVTTVATASTTATVTTATPSTAITGTAALTTSAATTSAATTSAATTSTTSDPATSAATAPSGSTVPLTVATTVPSPLPDGAVLASVVSVDGNQVTWSVRCGVQRDGGAVDATTVRLPLAVSTITADTGAEGTDGSVSLDAATWAASRTAGLWWVTVQNGRVTNVVSSRLVTTRCV